MRAATPLVIVALLLAAAPSAAAAVTLSCELVPHGFLFGINTNGCSVTSTATQSVKAVVSVIVGTIDAIEIEMQGPNAQQHTFVCAFAVTSSVCALPAQQTNVVDGAWTVRARIVGADPLGPLVYGGADTYARLDATFT